MNRAVNPLIQEYLQYFPCVAVLGPRQCGKTTVLRQLGSTWTYFDLEKSSDYDLIHSDPDGFLRRHPESTAIDEAQVLPSLFPALRVAIDERRDQRGRFVLTGSSSPDLQKNLSESLAGRVGIIEMSPLSFAETDQTESSNLWPLLHWEEPTTPRNLTPSRSQALEEYWFEGGYPEPWLRNQRRFRTVWRENYLKTYLERDLRRLFPGLDPNRFRNFLAMLAAMSGSIINMSDLGTGTCQQPSLDPSPMTHEVQLPAEQFVQN